MKLAVLGTDAEILRLLAEAISLGHEIRWVGDIRSEDNLEIARLAPNLADRADDWEVLLDGGNADSVLVGCGSATSELRAEQLKRLATEALPVLAVHPVGESVLTYYELDMIRRETGALLWHYNPWMGHPILLELAAWVRDGHQEIGPIHQVTCERRLRQATREIVLSYLARDVELIAAVAGDIRRVSAIGPQEDEASFASLQVQMSTERLASLRWSVGARAQFGSGLTTALLGERGVVKLHAQDRGSNTDIHWQLETQVDGEPIQRPLAPHNAPRIALEAFAAAVTAQRSEPMPVASTWDVATRAMEVVDASRLSLEKGRTIDVVQQQLTERLAFRGAMAAIGCGLLLFGFAVILLIALVGGLEGIAGQRLIPYWPFALLAVLAFFLMLQAVPVLASKSKWRDRG